MVYPVFLQNLRVAVDQTVLLYTAVSTREQGRLCDEIPYQVRIYEDRFASILMDR